MKNEPILIDAKFVNFYGYSDVTPYEIVRVVSENCIEIRKMDAKLAEGEKPEIIVGGFSGHCVNQRSLKYDISSNEAYNLIRIRKSKKGWGKGAYRLSDKPIYFYDYNF